MKYSVRTVLGIVLAVLVFLFYVSNVRPVGWFDSLVALILAFATFWVVRTFQGFKR